MLTLEPNPLRSYASCFWTDAEEPASGPHHATSLEGDAFSLSAG